MIFIIAIESFTREFGGRSMFGHGGEPAGTRIKKRLRNPNVRKLPYPAFGWESHRKPIKLFPSKTLPCAGRACRSRFRPMMQRHQEGGAESVAPRYNKRNSKCSVADVNGTHRLKAPIRINTRTHPARSTPKCPTYSFVKHLIHKLVPPIRLTFRRRVLSEERLHNAWFQSDQRSVFVAGAKSSP